MVYIYYPFSGDEVSLYDHDKERTICLYSPEAVSPPLKRMFLSFEEKFDVTSYALDLSFTPSSSRLSGRARIEVVPKVDVLDSLKFRFNPDLEILKITDDEGRELFHTVDKVRKILYVYFLSPAAGGDPTSIEVFYRGRMLPATPTTDVIGQSGLNDKIRIRPRYETSFYTHAGFWYPGPAEEDYFTARLTLIVPPEYKCVANGELVAAGRREDMDDVAALEHAGHAVYTFVSRAPVKYLSFIVGKFDQSKERPGPVPVSTYVSTEIMDSQRALVRSGGRHPRVLCRRLRPLSLREAGHRPPALARLRRPQPGVLHRHQPSPLARRTASRCRAIRPSTCRTGRNIFWLTRSPTSGGARACPSIPTRTSG